MDNDDENLHFDFSNETEEMDFCLGSDFRHLPAVVPFFESLKPKEIVKLMNEEIKHVVSVVQVSLILVKYTVFSSNFKYF